VPDNAEQKPSDSQTPAESPSVESRPNPAPSVVDASGNLLIDETVTPDVLWDRYFATGRQELVAVRGHVRQLMKTGRYNHVVALIQSALRHGQPQPWMYESLGIAMQLEGMPKSQIERAVMSAIDFSSTPDELMFIAQYMQQINLDERAASVYRQVTRIDPLRSEAYVLAMRCGERTGDLETLEWSTLGVLSQAWPENQTIVRDTALRLAQVAVDQLAERGDQQRLDRYQEQLAASLERDCVVRISWTGDADLDLVVEEPTGSICSIHDPRTVGGGVSLGDSFSVTGAAGAGLFTETYVCPKGFSGQYRAKIQPVWGKVTANKVTVDVYTNYNSAKPTHHRQQIELGKDGAVVNFRLDRGRLEQPLAVGQVAAAAARQDKISRAMLAEQIGSMSDPGVVPVRPGAAQQNRLNRLLAAADGGALGFQPVIEVLPEGVNFSVTAVVSADRRYVRVTPSPTFSLIGDVTTFTFAGAGQQVDMGDDDDDDAGGGAGGGANN
jgi:hypothetical protein